MRRRQRPDVRDPEDHPGPHDPDDAGRRAAASRGGDDLHHLDDVDDVDDRGGRRDAGDATGGATPGRQRRPAAPAARAPAEPQAQPDAGGQAAPETGGGAEQPEDTGGAQAGGASSEFCANNPGAC